MRVSLRFVMMWVMVFALLSVAGAAGSYFFVRDRAAELDEVLELPAPPQLFAESARVNTPVPTVAAPEPTALPDSTGLEGTAAVESDPPASDSDDASAPPPDAVSGEESVDAVVANVLEAQSALLNDPRRVNVLLMGIDQRQGEVGPFPTDTLILFSLDPAGKTGAILSIPRDLWVEYPEFGVADRVNTANIRGEEANYPGGGGPIYTVRTVERVLGINIKYYVMINFEVFTTLIDAIGPIEVCPEEAIDDDNYPDGSYGVISIHFDAGCQDLDAERLLQYARTRHGDSDIARSSRQQEVILAVRDKVLSTGGVMDLIPKAATLWESVQENIRSNLSFEDTVSMALVAEDVPAENIRQSQITFEEVYISTTPNGDEILIPISTDIRLLLEDLFRPAGAPSTRQ